MPFSLRNYARMHPTFILAAQLENHKTLNAEQLHRFQKQNVKKDKSQGCNLDIHLPNASSTVPLEGYDDFSIPGSYSLNIRPGMETTRPHKATFLNRLLRCRYFRVIMVRHWMI